jgi:pimeloyl-ACP methyl ester carboxylesterase
MRFETENYLIENVGKIWDIPAVIVQGRYDVVCPMMSAWDLHKACRKPNYALCRTQAIPRWRRELFRRSSKRRIAFVKSRIEISGFALFFIVA